MKPLLLPIILFFPQIKYLFSAGENSSNELGHENTKINLINNFPNPNHDDEEEENDEFEDEDNSNIHNNNYDNNSVISVAYGMNHVACVMNNVYINYNINIYLNFFVLFYYRIIYIHGV